MNKKDIWNEGIVVFDTSVLIDCYMHSPDSIRYIISQLSSQFAGRLWLTSHIEFEYLKHKEVKKTAAIPKYLQLKKSEGGNKPFGYLSKISEHTENLSGVVKTLYDETRLKDKHPWLDESITKPLVEITKTYVAAIQAEVEKVENTIDAQVTSIKAAQDIVFDELIPLFNVSRVYSFAEKYSICKQGVIRYQMEMPPGYMDATGQNKKEGLDKYSDLIIWFQIMEISFDHSHPVNFVTKDLKIDWCIKEDGHQDRIKFPRTELVDEFREHTGSDFWMYSFPQFLYELEQNAKEKSPESSIIEKVNEKSISIPLRATNSDSEFWGITHDISGICTVSKDEIKVWVNSFTLTNRKEFSFYIFEIALVISSKTNKGWKKVKTGLPFIVNKNIGVGETLEFNDFEISVMRGEIDNLDDYDLTFEVWSQAEMKDSKGTMYSHWNGIKDLKPEKESVQKQTESNIDYPPSGTPA